MNGSNFPSAGWEITFREGWWLWSALGLALILLAVHSYRRTIPPLPPRRRALLFGLRLLALCAFILAILNPRLERRGMEPRPRRIALLVDESRSIARAGQESAVRSILASAQMERVSALADVVALGFADTVRVLDEATLSFRGPATEIGEAILSQRRVFPPPDAIILITDGSNTSGSEPVRAAQEAALPTYVVGVGNPHPEPDARIVGVAAPPYAVEGKPVSVTVAWEHTIPGMRASTMRLFHQGREITRAIVLPPETGARADVDLTFTPSARGMQTYTVELEGVPGESRTENNRRTFSLDVVKATTRALIIAGLQAPMSASGIVSSAHARITIPQSGTQPLFVALLHSPRTVLRGQTSLSGSTLPGTHCLLSLRTRWCGPLKKAVGSCVSSERTAYRLACVKYCLSS